MLRIQCITFDCENPAVPAEFWSKALDWPITIANDEEVVVEDPNGGADLLFLRETLRCGALRTGLMDHE